MRLNRRTVISGLAAICVAGLGLAYNLSVGEQPSLRASAASAMTPGAPEYNTGGAQAAFKRAELEVPGPQGDRILGQATAPVTIIEYASMTCPHCAAFATGTYPDLKKQYIDTGKVRYIFREFPLDDLALIAAMIARCAPQDQYFDLIALMFETQRNWATAPNKLQALFNLVKQTGFTQESFDACWKNQANINAVRAVAERATKVFGVNGTPTFFINGVKKDGELDIKALEAVMAPMLK
jgi:protein-disulfide isomerase